MNIEAIVENYNQRVSNLQNIYNEGGARKCAYETGDVFEKIIDDIVVDIDHLISLKNDYLTVECDGYKMNNVQVDRHIRRKSDNSICIVIESKTYLDSCYCKRAVVDFIEIQGSKEVFEDVSFVIITGQVSISKKTFNYYQAFCKKHTGKNFKLFVLNENKKRDSKKPIYKEKFILDVKELKNLYDYIASF